MHSRFNLVLMVNHACNLRCSYCYTGAKFSRAMPRFVGEHAIQRAFQSLIPEGVLELGFFGGEPLLEAALISDFMKYARSAAQQTNRSVEMCLTTNGTLADGSAWEVLADPLVDLAISHDGIPAIHNRHRRSQDGATTSKVVEGTLQKLIAAGKQFRVVMVVRPDGLDSLAEGISYLAWVGVRRLELSLDLWTKWAKGDGARLERAVGECANLWRSMTPRLEINWFDEKVAAIGQIPSSTTARCGFGAGQIAVAPSGNLYPCERLIGEDLESNPMRLHGYALDEGPFSGEQPVNAAAAAVCSGCEVQWLCGNQCRCSNYVRTGNVYEPDGLLCLIEQLCIQETARVVGSSNLVTIR